MIKISIIMPVYNAEKYIYEAIDSILNQTIEDFELIIVNDGSTDNSEEIIKSFNDTRIKYYRNDINRGLIYSLNRAISISTGEYIARMDSDDISLPNRLEEQISYLEKNKDISIVGSWAEIFGKGVRKKYYKPEILHDSIRANMFFRCELVHPSVVYRKTFVDSMKILYDEDYKSCEDYQLWVRALKKYKCANIPKVLLKYRYVSNSVTRIADLKENKVNRDNLHKKIYKQMLIEFKFYPDNEELDVHRIISTEETIKSIDILYKIEKYLNKLIEHNCIHQIIDVKSFSNQMGYWWYRCCRRYINKRVGIHVYNKSSLRGQYNPSIKDRIAFLKKI